MESARGACAGCAAGQKGHTGTCDATAQAVSHLDPAPGPVADAGPDPGAVADNGPPTCDKHAAADEYAAPAYARSVVPTRSATVATRAAATCARTATTGARPGSATTDADAAASSQRRRHWRASTPRHANPYAAS